MSSMFDPTISPDAAIARLVAFSTDPGSPPDVAEAMRVILEERLTLRQIATQARTVRACQKRYFADRTGESLTASKEAERRLDAMLKE